MKKRKLTQERADRINRQRDQREGGANVEHDAFRAVLIDGRPVDLPHGGPIPEPIRDRE